MYRRAITAGVAAGILALSLVGAVGAASGVSTTITVTGDNGAETFTTSGAALCPSGTSEDVFEKFGGSGHSPCRLVPRLQGTYLRRQGSGTFNISYDASTVFGSPTDNGGWHLYDGHRRLCRLLRRRQPGWDISTDTGIIDSYTGQVSTN